MVRSLDAHATAVAQHPGREYIKQWIDNGYPEPPGGWDPYDIRHILPREYGGTNDFWNLVPVERDLHQQILTPWGNAFNP